MLCEWCGVAHDPAALCHARPRWTRRGFLTLALTGVAALVTAPFVELVAPPLPPATAESIGEIVARAWAKHVQGPEDNIFSSQYLLAQLAKEKPVWYAPVRSSVYHVRVGR